jgi:hypothetical protein
MVENFTHQIVGTFDHCQHASRQKEHTELNCNVYSIMVDTTIIIKVKDQVTIQYWHKGDNYYSTYWSMTLMACRFFWGMFI